MAEPHELDARAMKARLEATERELVLALDNYARALERADVYRQMWTLAASQRDALIEAAAASPEQLANEAGELSGT